MLQATVMVAGLKRHQGRLKRRGADEAFVGSMEGSIQRLTALNAEQESLKGRLKETTAEIEKEQEALKDAQAEARKMVKLELEQPVWREFNILDVR